ncbi:hypothetical protein BY458DRAFT_435108 [Sporodiniella umbellata]|nr:hypothetical protein BY458DRAFT_435108 [Sporodiniella umbellata]
MSPYVIEPTEEINDSEMDMKKWMKEIEEAEELMTNVETKADALQSKIDALLEEVTPHDILEDKNKKN